MTASEIRAKAREQLDGKKMNAALALLVFFIIEGILNAIANALFPGQTAIINGVQMQQQSTVASIIESAVGIFLGLGMTSYYMKIARGEQPEIMEIFSKGNLFLKAFITAILTGFAVLGGMLLLIIPGIILVFAYSMINYIYIDNPEIGIVEVMKKSRQIMKGHKWQFFCLGFSFIGWIILGIFTLGILYFWLIPYMGVAQAKFYDSIKEA